MFLTGSKLAKRYFPDFREPHDTDWIVFDPEDVKKTIPGVEEFHLLPCSPMREMTPDELYTVKVSHAVYDIHWDKTMSDIRFFQIKGCQILPGFLSELRAHWNVYHGPQKRTDFGIDPTKFFKDNVKRVVPHDDLHVMLKDPPSYLKILNKGEIVPREEKFNNDLTLQEQLDIGFEESFVIALERFGSVNNLSAYHKAQQALVTRIHPLWMADFIIQNWNKAFWTGGKGGCLYKRYLELRKQLNHD
jgi:hypothetical protein